MICIDTPGSEYIWIVYLLADLLIGIFNNLIFLDEVRWKFSLYLGLRLFKIPLYVLYNIYILDYWENYLEISVKRYF